MGVVAHTAGVLHDDYRRAGSFGHDADQYDRARPTYPDSLAEFLLAGIDSEHDAVRVIDVGCGTGIVSRLFSRHGCRVLGVEADPRMARVAAEQGTDVEVARFEDWDARGRTFDLLTAGQSWHWVHPQTGATKAAEILRPGGRVGLSWNQGRQDDSVRAGIEAVYQRLAPDLDKHSILVRRVDPARWKGTGEVLERAGGFAEIEIRSFPWERTYTRDEWLDQLPTHSDHRLLADDQRAELLAEIGAVIDAAGGAFVMRYETWTVSAVRT